MSMQSQKLAADIRILVRDAKELAKATARANGSPLPSDCAPRARVCGFEHGMLPIESRCSLLVLPLMVRSEYTTPNIAKPDHYSGSAKQFRCPKP